MNIRRIKVSRIQTCTLYAMNNRRIKVSRIQTCAINRYRIQIYAKIIQAIYVLDTHLHGSTYLILLNQLTFFRYINYQRTLWSFMVTPGAFTC